VRTTLRPHFDGWFAPMVVVRISGNDSPKRSFEISSHKGKTFESTQEEIRSIQLLK